MTTHIQQFDASKKSDIFKFILTNIRELFFFRYALINFISTNLSSRYRRSVIGFLWSLLNPLFTMLIMAVVFSSLYKRSFAEFGLYIFSGLLPWSLITSSLQGGTRSLISSEMYLKKVYIPKILFPLITLGVEVSNFCLSLISLFFLTFIFGSKLGFSLILLPIALLVLSIFLFGLILILSIATVFFRDLLHIIQIITLGLFYITPILYQKNMLTEPLRVLITYNPFYYFIDLFHLIIYGANFPSLADWVPCLLLAMISFIVGVFIFHKKENEVIYRL